MKLQKSADESTVDKFFEPTIFFVRAIARKKILRKTIKTYYDKNKEHYATIAKKNPWYDCRYFKENDYEEEIACLQLLGIFTDFIDSETEETKFFFINLIRRGYPEVWQFAEKYKILDFEAFFLDVVIKIENDLTINSCLGTLIMLTMLTGQKYKKVEKDNKIGEIVATMMQVIVEYHHNAREIIVRNLNPTVKTEAKKIKEMIEITGYKNKLSDFNNGYFFGEYERLYNWIVLQAKQDNLPLAAIESVQFSKKEIEDIYSYLAILNFNANENSEELLNCYMGIAVIIRSYEKRYHELKSYTRKISGELEDLEEVKKLKNEVASERKEKEKAKDELGIYKNLAEARNPIKQQVEIDKLKTQIQTQATLLSELKAELIEQNNLIDELMLPAKASEKVKIKILGKTVVVGGHPTWVAKIAAVHNNLIFADGATAIDAVKGADQIIIKFDQLAHSTFYPIIKFARQNNISVIYVSGAQDLFIN